MIRRPPRSALFPYTALFRSPDLAVVVIGANDLTRFVPVDSAVGALASAVRDLRAVGTDVVVVPAPDMSSIPVVPPAFRPAVQADRKSTRLNSSHVNISYAVF